MAEMTLCFSVHVQPDVAVDPLAVHNAVMRVRTLQILMLFVTLPAVMRVRALWILMLFVTLRCVYVHYRSSCCLLRCDACMYTTDPHAVCYAACCDACTYALDPHAVYNAAMRVRTLWILMLFVTLR